MLSLRLQRVGRKGDPSYRIVATDSKSGPKTNKHVAVLGHHDAIRKTTVINDVDEVKKFLGYGAKVTDTLYNILIKQGIIEGKKKNVLPKKSPIVDEEAIAAAKAAEEKAAAAKLAEEEAAKVAAAEPAKDEVAGSEEVPSTEAPEAEESVTEEAAEETVTEEVTDEETPAEEEKKD